MCKHRVLLVEGERGAKDQLPQTSSHFALLVWGKWSDEKLQIIIIIKKKTILWAPTNQITGNIQRKTRGEPRSLANDQWPSTETRKKTLMGQLLKGPIIKNMADVNFHSIEKNRKSKLIFIFYKKDFFPHGILTTPFPILWSSICEKANKMGEKLAIPFAHK